MHPRHWISLAIVMIVATGPAVAQLALPPTGGVVGDVVDTANATTRDIVDPVTGALRTASQSASRLARARLARIDALVAGSQGRIALDSDGQPARADVLIIIDASGQQLAEAAAAGFVSRGSEQLGTLGITITRLAVPPRQSLARAQRRLSRLIPSAQISSDAIFFTAGQDAPGRAAPPVPAIAPVATTVGMIDGAPRAMPGIQQRGFARGAPLASNHGTAIAYLLRFAGVRSIRVADVYGDDPAGGNALAIATALDWMVETRTRIVSISLVGPRNALLERAVAAARQRGITIVAAVGNDGPAAPAAWPASATGVVAVTAVDGRNRAIIEAGRALHLDYAAPGADIGAPGIDGSIRRLRGTSFAVPLVAARAAAAVDRGRDPIATLDGEATDLGPRGTDDRFGRGLLCAACRPQGE